MRLWSEVVEGVHALTRRAREERELAEELDFHLDMEAERNARAGMSPAEARRAARLALGGVEQVKEEVRDARSVRWLEDLVQDARYALRALRKNPTFAAAAILTLAVGIGVNSAVFSVVNAVVLRQLPYAQPDRLMTFGYLMKGEYLVLRERARRVTDPAQFSSVGLNLSEVGGADRVQGAQVSPNLFGLLGARPLLGRAFLPGEAAPGSGSVVMIGEGLWRQRFGGSPGAIGRRILVDGIPRTIVGIMGASFRFPSAETVVWVPAPLDPRDAVALWGGAGGETIARLAPGATPLQAQREIRALGRDFRSANTLWTPAPDWGNTRTAERLRDTVVAGVRRQLLILLAAVGFVLLIACANVSNLLLARGAAREAELAVRGALGAARRRLFTQMLTESLVLGLMGAGLGLLMAVLAVRLLVRGLPPDMPRVTEIGIDARVLAFTLALALAATLFSGLFPAVRASRSDLQSALRRVAGTGRLGSARLTGALVAVEFAVAVLLVIGAGLLIRSFAELLRVDPGFRPERIVSARVTPPPSQYDSTRLRVFYPELLARVRAIPGASAAAAVSQLPLVSTYAGMAFEVEGQPYRPGAKAPVFEDRRVTPGYTRLMGIRLLQGRPLAESDREGAPRVALVNETMARRFWPGQDPVGKRFKEVWLHDWTTVVGVAGDVRSFGLAASLEPEVYRPFAQLPTNDMALVIRTREDPGPLAAQLRAALREVDPHVPVSDVRTGDELVVASLSGTRFLTLLLSVFALLAVTLAAIGIYGVMSYAVTRRTREIGLRVALGAGRAEVVRMVLRQAFRFAGAGALAGLAGALVATRLLRSVLFHIAPTDPLTLLTVPLLLLGVALLAAYLPGRRAARTDPLVALRAE